jgi:hypothetical protein
MADLHRLDGLFVGQLDDDELEMFNRACREGRARRVYRGSSGFMGLAKVEVVLAPQESPHAR